MNLSKFLCLFALLLLDVLATQNHSQVPEPENDQDDDYIYHTLVVIPSQLLKRQHENDPPIPFAQECLNDLSTVVNAAVFKKDHHPNNEVGAKQLTPDLLKSEYNMDTIAIVTPGPGYKDHDSLLIFANVKQRGEDQTLRTGIDDNIVDVIKHELTTTLGNHQEAKD